jgi:hypothetical protein
MATYSIIRHTSTLKYFLITSDNSTGIFDSFLQSLSSASDYTDSPSTDQTLHIKKTWGKLWNQIFTEKDEKNLTFFWKDGSIEQKRYPSTANSTL